ncbi:hypothetical protein D1BOALGB6SA_1897 [Olavius sp. associated proteobacterium Delta 1]|nr:hypothetical protein D1BOALGB6SA_1897 [Olavius sp. associated proteobacterium Delta 1]
MKSFFHNKAIFSPCQEKIFLFFFKFWFWRLYDCSIGNGDYLDLGIGILDCGLIMVAVVNFGF